MAQDAIFTEDFKEAPFWWEDFRPASESLADLPARCDVLVVGSGYAGLGSALPLADAGVQVMVLDAAPLGFGASTRSGGQVTGGINVGKVPSGRKPAAGSGFATRKAALMRDAADGMTLLESLIERHGINCGYHATGRLTAAWTPAHYSSLERRVEELNEHTGAGAFMVPPKDMPDELGSSFYFGGMVIRRAGHLQPALLYKGLLDGVRKSGAQVAGDTSVLAIKRQAGGFEVSTSRGKIVADQVVVATNGYSGSVTGQLQRSLLTIKTHMIATEPLAPEIARSLIPMNRAVAETRRVMNHYRLSPDGTRLLFGGRARFHRLDNQNSARVLYRQMLARFPQLRNVRLSHVWDGNIALSLDYLPHVGSDRGLHHCLACNGSGVAMMTYLGHALGRKILSGSQAPACAYDTGSMPTHPLYFGRPWFMPVIGNYYIVRDVLDRRSIRRHNKTS